MLGGTFDLYGMALPFLNKVYSPSGNTSVFPENLYNEILTYQAKNDRTAKFTLPEGLSTGKDGRFKSGIFSDPMEESPFHIVVTDIQQVNKLNVKSDYGRPTDAWDGPGLKANMVIKDGGCGIASSSGSISMRPLWKKVDKDGKVMELYEGALTFNVTYSSLYSRKGHGHGQRETLAFWGIREKA
jgi:hypothetical protein